MPSGITTTDLRLNDFVVYDSAQVKIRYVVDVDFINKNWKHIRYDIDW